MKFEISAATTWRWCFDCAALVLQRTGMSSSLGNLGHLLYTSEWQDSWPYNRLHSFTVCLHAISWSHCNTTFELTSFDEKCFRLVVPIDSLPRKVIFVFIFQRRVLWAQHWVFIPAYSIDAQLRYRGSEVYVWLSVSNWMWVARKQKAINEKWSHRPQRRLRMCSLKVPWQPTASRCVVLCSSPPSASRHFERESLG